MPRRATTALLCFALWAAGCSHDWDRLEPTGSDASTVGGSGGNNAGAGGVDAGGTGGAAASGGAGAGGGSGGQAVKCPDPTMALLSADFGVQYCVDAREVTNAEYEAFLDLGQHTTSTECAWNTSLVPAGNWPPTAATANRPVAFVDQCDARAYCEAVGKRLCGRIGGGNNPLADFADASQSEWFNACSAGDTRAYPYGSTYDPNRCNGIDYAAGEPVTAGSLSSCEGGVAGLFDLSGNLFEWEESCSDSTGAEDNCRIRGGGFNSNSANLRCEAAAAEKRDTATVTIGFRCCADAEPL